MAASSPRWASDLRTQLKREHGFGWTVREIHGQVQLTRRWEDSSRSSVVLPIDWNAACARAVLNAVADIRDRMETHNLSLKEAQELLQGGDAEPQRPEGGLNWRAIADAFLASRAINAPHPSATSARAWRTEGGGGSSCCTPHAGAPPQAAVRQRQTPQRRAAEHAVPGLTTWRICWRSLEADDKTSLWPGRRPCWAEWPAAGSAARWGCHQPPLPRPLAGAVTLRRSSLSDSSTQCAAPPAAETRSAATTARG